MENAELKLLNDLINEISYLASSNCLLRVRHNLLGYFFWLVCYEYKRSALVFYFIKRLLNLNNLKQYMKEQV